MKKNSTATTDREALWEIYLAITDAIKETGGEVKLGDLAGNVVNLAYEKLADNHRKKLNLQITLK